MLQLSMIVSSPPDLVFSVGFVILNLRGLQVLSGRQVKPSMYIQLRSVDSQ
jgi:hypothetical protein